MGLQLELGLADYEERAIQLLTAATSLLLFLFEQQLPLGALVPRYFLIVSFLNLTRLLIYPELKEGAIGLVDL